MAPSDGLEAMVKKKQKPFISSAGNRTPVVQPVA
jgi:hypothetical protein